MTKAGTCPHCGAGLVDGAALCEVCGGVARDSGTIPIVRDAALSSTDPVLDRASLEPRPMGSSGAGGQSLAFDSMDYIATALDSEEENEEEILATGMWHILVSEEEEEGTFATPFDQAPVDLPPGIRVRRVEGQVEVEVLDDAKLVTLDGQPVEGLFRANLALQMVVVDSEPLLDSMVPQDVLTQDDLPEFFAPIVIGRDSVCDVVLDSRAVSGQHLSLSRREGHLLLEDLDSINGTFVENRRIKRARIGWRQPFRVADQVMTAVDVVLQVRTRRAAASTSIVSALSPEALGVDHAPAQLGPTSDLGPGSSQDFPAGSISSCAIGLAVGETLVVGRDMSADIVIDSPNVSRRHTRITRMTNGYEVEDLGSTNGTRVNGKRIGAAVHITLDDDLRIGPHRLHLDGSDRGVAEDLDGTQQVTGVRLDGVKLVRQVGDPKDPLTVVDRVSFSILPGEMVAVMGPSGAGKTSVLTTVAGYTPPSSGDLLIDGLSLYRHYALFRRAIGYVPQEDVMHRILTVAEVLHYQAKLEFPADVSDSEISDRIDTVLGQLDLSRVRDSIVGDEVRRGLSGGQRKRLNVAMELLGEPSLLILDEPTSGLDARSAMELIRQCRELATAGRTVIMTIHQPRLEAFDLFDKVLFLTVGGKVAYFGPSDGVKHYFQTRSDVSESSAVNPADFALDVLDPVDPKLAKKPEYWRRQFNKSEQSSKFVDARFATEVQFESGGPVERGSRPNPLIQFVHLCRRYAVTKWRDRSALIVQMVQAPVIAALAVLLFHKGRFMPLYLEDDVTPALFVLMASAVWFGCSNVAREIVGERAIFRRERMGSLLPGPYLASKMLLQGTLIVIQVGVLLAILVPTVPLEGDILGLAGVTVLAGWSAMALGLLLSALAATELQAIQFVPLAILPQIMLSGILIPVGGDSATPVAVWLSKPVLLRWAYSAALHTEFAESTARGDKSRGVAGAKYWERSGFGEDTLGLDLAVMGGLGIACALGAWLILALRDRR